jgi:hypothetical protein
MPQIRRSYWVDSSLLMMMEDKGVVMSTFINKAMASFLELPDDPNERLLRENINSAAIRVRISYLNEIRDRITKAEMDETQSNAEKAKQKAINQKLMEVGEQLRRTSVYTRIIKALDKLDGEDPIWDTAIEEFNDVNGTDYDFLSLWNLSIAWYKAYGKP